MKRLLAAAAIAAVASPAVAQDLRICVEGAYPPFSELNEQGEIVGFDIDITNALCDEMDVECELVQTEWDGIIPALTEGKCDAIIASMSITPERQERIDFSEPYYNTPAKFIGPADANLDDTQEALEGKTVGVQRGTIHQDFMEGEFPNVDLKLYGTQDEAYLDLQAGRIDAIMVDSVAADYGFLRTEQGEGFAFFGDDYSIPKYHGVGAGIGVRKEDNVLEYAFSQAIEEIREKGVYTKINDKYFDFDLYSGVESQGM